MADNPGALPATASETASASSGQDAALRLTFASYNIHKGIGRDRRRDADRIMTVLHELDADIIALQEADRRFGTREAVLPRQLIEEQHWRIVPCAGRPASMGWHGNAILVRRDIEIVETQPISLPALEPRGAIRASLRYNGRPFEVVGMHLDLSGLLRRKQIVAVCAHLADRGAASVMMGDLNEWSPRRGALLAFAKEWAVLNPGKSFPSSQPLAPLDRIVHSPHWRCEGTSVHHSALAAVASDHLPVRATLTLMPA
jgi:endonuclease/exonuclease/phosphatase family metal-dependent hydrolase